MIRSLLIFFTFCGCCRKHGDKPEKDYVSDSFGVNRYYDNDHNVVCYTQYSHGISCLQLKYSPEDGKEK